MSTIGHAARCLLSLLVLFPVAIKAATTPCNIQTLFTKACSDKNQTSVICASGWQAFYQSFAGKNWNSSQFSDYDPYFDVFPLPTNITNKALFWTGTDTLQAALTSRAGLTSSANILSIEIVNQMQSAYNVTAWCGNISGGIDCTSTNCPGYIPGTATPVYTFYATFSDRLASISVGVVFFLTVNTFRNTSVFAQIELPRLLSSAAVTKVVVLNVYLYSNGTCDQTTSPLLDIQAKVTASGKAYSCVDVFGDASLQPPSDALLAALAQAIKNQISKGRVNFCIFSELI